MRNMSFFLTTQQFLDYCKDLTRRIGWGFLKPGEHFMAIEKGQGLKFGEHVWRLGECICISNEPEPLLAICRLPIRGLRSECGREGFPEMTPREFVKMFCEANSKGKKRCYPDTIINRIEFRRLD